MSKKTVAACKECGRKMEISGRGLCGKCYSALKKLEKKSVQPEAVPVHDACAFCGSFYSLDELAMNSDNECPGCGQNYVTGEKNPNWGTRVKSDTEPLNIPPISVVKTVTKSTNPLLPPAVECEVVLNFDGRGDLLSWLQANDVTPDHVIELLDLGRQGKLRTAP